MADRRDSKGRKLYTGESQEKSGRYRFSYREGGKQHCLYSWRLTDTDVLPSGKRPCQSLRSQIKEYNQAKERGIAFRGNNITVLELVEKYLKLHDSEVGRKHSTVVGQSIAVKHLKETKLSRQRIDKVKKSDAKDWVISLQNEDGLSFSSIRSIVGIVRPAFQMAVEEDYIMRNPFDFSWNAFVQDDSRKRDALNKEKKQEFLDFIKKDSYYCKYYNAIAILFETGMRISELCALTRNDIDLQERTVTISCQLQYDKGYYIEATKTKCGERTIILSDKAYDCFKELIANRPKLKREPNIDGRIGFLFLGRNGMPCYGALWGHRFKYICEKYNRTHDEKLPPVTPHICRHTFATEMAGIGMKPFILKQYMGHESINITSQCYIHINENQIRNEMQRLNLIKAAKSWSDTKTAEFVGLTA